MGWESGRLIPQCIALYSLSVALWACCLLNYVAEISLPMVRSYATLHVVKSFEMLDGFPWNC
uniref:Uncharacterized protein n=1 Tax=Arundo donax TaxID=35708 RepID=A0A0A9C0H3_ARUDO